MPEDARVKEKQEKTENYQALVIVLSETLLEAVQSWKEKLLKLDSNNKKKKPKSATRCIAGIAQNTNKENFESPSSSNPGLLHWKTQTS